MTIAGRPPAGTSPWDWYWRQWSSEVSIELADLPTNLHALTTWRSGRPWRLYLNYKLTPEQGRTALAHELHHLAIGGVCSPECPRNEEIVARETARWLLPDVDRLALLVATKPLGCAAAELGVARSTVLQRIQQMTPAEHAAFYGATGLDETAMAGVESAGMTPPEQPQSGPAPLTYTIEAAANRLGGPFTVDWLRKHTHEIPHLKTGGGTGRAGRIGFTEAQLERIVAMVSVEPAGAPDDPDDWGIRSRRR